MATITMGVMSSPEVAGLLHQELGNHREWSNFLADCRRGKSSSSKLSGYHLTPVARLIGRAGTCARPVYEAADVEAFIKSFRTLHGAARLESEVKEIQIEEGDLRFWRVRKVPLFLKH
jgi:hypothetical protein